MKPIEAREGNNGGSGRQGKVHAGPGWTAKHDAGKFAAFTPAGDAAPRARCVAQGTRSLRSHALIAT